MAESKYVIVFATGDGVVMCTSVLDGICSRAARKEIRGIFAETMIADFAVIWRHDNVHITKTEQDDIARCMREAVTPGWTLTSDTTPIRGGKFGRKYVDSQSCMVVEWNGLRLPSKYSHWDDFVFQCRLDGQGMVMHNMTGPDNMHASPYGRVQSERDADPGYLEQVKEHATRHNTVKQSELPEFGDGMIRQCIECVKKGNNEKLLTILANEYNIPPPKTSTDISRYPLSYAFYDTASRTIVLMPKSMASTEMDIMGIIAGFLRCLAHHHGWRFHDDPSSSLNYELEMASEIATAMANMLSSHIGR